MSTVVLDNQPIVPGNSTLTLLASSGTVAPNHVRVMYSDTDSTNAPRIYIYFGYVQSNVDRPFMTIYEADFPTDDQVEGCEGTFIEYHGGGQTFQFVISGNTMTMKDELGSDIYSCTHDRFGEAQLLSVSRTSGQNVIVQSVTPSPFSSSTPVTSSVPVSSSNPPSSNSLPPARNTGSSGVNVWLIVGIAGAVLLAALGGFLLYRRQRAIREAEELYEMQMNAYRQRQRQGYYSPQQAAPQYRQ